MEISQQVEKDKQAKASKVGKAGDKSCLFWCCFGVSIAAVGLQIPEHKKYEY